VTPDHADVQIIRVPADRARGCRPAIGAAPATPARGRAGERASTSDRATLGRQASSTEPVAGHLTEPAHNLLDLLTQRADDQGRVLLGNGELANVLHRSPRTVARHVAALVRGGSISLTHSPDCKRYRTIHLHAPTQMRPT
jgi:hypothetical protein